MRLTRLRQLPARARRFGLAAGLLLASGCGLFELSGEPILLTIDPEEGVPGTTVTLTGSRLGSPDNDTELELHFGEFLLTFVDNDEVTEWGPRSIVFTVPLAAQTGEVEVWVKTSEGETDRLTFKVNAPGAQIAKDFVGAAVLADRESVAMFRMQKDLSGEYPVLTLQDWSAGRGVTEVALGREGFTTRIWDVVLETEGQTTVAYSRTPTEGSSHDGEDGLLVLRPDYVTPFTAYETAVRPRRMAATGLIQARSREILVLGEAGAAVEYFGGAQFVPRGMLSLSSIAVDARADAALALPGAGRFLIAGHGELTGESFLAVSALEPDTGAGEDYLQLLSAAQGVTELGRGLDDERVADLAVRGYAPFTESTDWNVTEIFVAYNAAVSGEAGGLLMFRKTSTDVTTWEKVRMTFPSGERIVAMDRFAETLTGETVFEYLFVLVDAEDDADDRLIQVNLGPVTAPTFPAGDTTYQAWRAADMADGVTIDVGGVYVADVAAMEVRTILLPDGSERVLRDPSGMSVLPVGAEEGPTFVLVGSRGESADFLAVVSSLTFYDGDAAGVAYGEDAFDLPGTGVGAVACYRAEAAETP